MTPDRPATVTFLRSWLYVPGDDNRKLSRAATADADVVVLDLEDGVAGDRKVQARLSVAAALETLDFGATKRYVRINGPDSGEWEADVAATVDSDPDGYVIPKANTPSAVRQVSLLLDRAESRAGLAAIVAEEVAGVFRARETADVGGRLHAVMWGSEDLSASLGAFVSRDEHGRLLDLFLLVRAYVLLAGVEAGRAVIDTPFVAFRDAAGLEAEARGAARIGFTGKQAIHPAQVPLINEAFLPTSDEESVARRAIAALAAGGVGSVDGAMVDAPHLKRALKIVALADAARALQR